MWVGWSHMRWVRRAWGVQRPVDGQITGCRRCRRHHHDGGRGRAACRFRSGALRCFLGLGCFALCLGLLGGTLVFQGALVLRCLLGALLGAELGHHLTACLVRGAGAFGVGDAALRIGAAHHLGVGRGQGAQASAHQSGE